MQSAISGDATRTQYRQMSRKSCFARGAQTTALTAVMFRARFPDQILDRERRSKTRVELRQAHVDFVTQLGQSFNAIEQIAPNLLLRGFWQRRHSG